MSTNESQKKRKAWISTVNKSIVACLIAVTIGILATAPIFSGVSYVAAQTTTDDETTTPPPNSSSSGNDEGTTTAEPTITSSEDKVKKKDPILICDDGSPPAADGKCYTVNPVLKCADGTDPVNGKCETEPRPGCRDPGYVVDSRKNKCVKAKE